MPPYFVTVEKAEKKWGGVKPERLSGGERRYRDHWWPEKPFKGQGYRCIRINDRMDPIVAHAGDMVGLSADYLCETIGHITMWG